MPSEIRTGYIKFYRPDRGFGFVCDDRSGQELFLHASELIEAFLPAAGQAVRFEAGVGDRGQPRALRVASLDRFR